MWKKLQQEIDKENERLRFEAPEEVVKVIHLRVIESESGTKKLSMGNWFFSFSDIRYVAAYLYQIMNLALDDSYTLAQIKLMASAMISQPADFAGYCGFETLRRYVMETIEALEEIEDREDLLGLLNSVFLYASHLHTWINHYFPWSYGFAFPIRNAEQVRDMQKYI
jgi:hypothetical protein